MTNPHTYNRSTIEEIAARNKTARHMVAGFSAEMPALADFWRHIDTTLVDNLALSVEVTRLNAELITSRLDKANLLAAIRATLAADADGETDPLYYLRDELNAPQNAREARGGGQR